MNAGMSHLTLVKKQSSKHKRRSTKFEKPKVLEEPDANIIKLKPVINEEQLCMCYLNLASAQLNPYQHENDPTFDHNGSVDFLIEQIHLNPGEKLLENFNKEATPFQIAFKYKN